jgi:hypothetical protein
LNIVLQSIWAAQLLRTDPLGKYYMSLADSPGQVTETEAKGKKDVESFAEVKGSINDGYVGVAMTTSTGRAAPTTPPISSHRSFDAHSIVSAMSFSLFACVFHTIISHQFCTYAHMCARTHAHGRTHVHALTHSYSLTHIRQCTRGHAWHDRPMPVQRQESGTLPMSVPRWTTMSMAMPRWRAALPQLYTTLLCTVGSLLVTSQYGMIPTEGTMVYLTEYLLVRVAIITSLVATYS